MLIQILTALGALAAALVLGGMIVFAGLVARLVFAHLPDETANPLLRKLFPPYYKFMLGAAVAGALCLAASSRLIDAGLMAVVALGFALANWWFMPQAHRLADTRSPDRPDVEAAFMTIQHKTARLGLIQVAATAAVIIRLAVVAP